MTIDEARRRRPAGQRAGPDPASRRCPQYLYQKVFILAVGNQPALQPGETASTDRTASAAAAGILTLEVPPDAVPWIDGRPGDRRASTCRWSPRTTCRAVIPIVPFDVPTLPGEDPSQLTPYGPTGTAGPTS